MADERNLLRVYNFVFELQGVRVAYFTEISALGVDIDVIEYREGGDAASVRTLPGLVRYPRITLSWGVTTSGEMWQWLMTAVNGRVEKRNGAVISLSPDGNREVVRYNLTQVWPCTWNSARFDALGNEAAIERVTLVAETLERVANAGAA
ncbi:phage tail protein [Thiococcus pfennigii]|jgi:phage tail-like protein|uniref:phage tail protein n=1 Tax=Thiococcus pfennigii TaxID=1057 RepID=UPI001906A805|nr:phage tail protein [Thiococcus pfennigii]MBK1699983.1 phage tail protein [Thiococcus pfennigii]MBK1730891.1 phage tail protein [Thiococcus pfennigii]